MPAPQSKPSRPTAILLLNQPLEVDGALLVETLRTLHPANCSGAVAIAAPDKPSHTSLLGIGRQIFALPSVGKQLPEGWRQIAARSIHWPYAFAVSSTHRAHRTVLLMGGEPDLLADARLTTAVAGAIAAAYPEHVLAGLWGTTVMNSAEVWTRLSANAFEPYPRLPTSLWVSQHLFKDDENGRVGVLTQGLSRFAGRELELTAPASDLTLLLDRTFRLTTYLIQNGPVLEDGDTVGDLESERFTVRLVVSARFGGLPVISGFFPRID